MLLLPEGSVKILRVAAFLPPVTFMAILKQGAG